MRSFAVVLLCRMEMFARSANAQTSILEPIHVPSGAVLTFHLQTRLIPGAGNELDVFPQLTCIREQA